MAATKSAGRVSIRVVPDSTRFRKDLKQSLDRIEKSLVAKIRAELFLDRASLVNLKRQIESLMVKIKPTIELNISLKDLEELKTKIESIKPKLNVDLDTKEAAARIAALTRTRTMNVRANLNRAGIAAIEGFATRIRAMAGLNLVMDSIRAGSEFMNNIDRKAVEFMKTISKAAGMIGTIGASLASIVSVSGDALGVGKLALFAPAVLTSAGIAIGVLVAVLKDMGTVLADMKPRFSALQDAMSNEFWKKAAQPIRDLADKYWPVLDKRLQHTARNLGRLTAAFAETITEGLGVERLDTMFERLNYAIADLRPAVRSFTKAFMNIGEVGTRFFPRFTTWMAKLGNQFENFIQKAYDDGRLEKWFEDGIQNAKDLGRVIGGVAETLNGIFKAAKAAGAPGLNDFANGMERVADIVQSPRFQANLTMLFQGMLELTDGIARGIKNLAPDIESFLPTLTNILGRFGKIFEDAFGIVGTIISNAEFQKGLSEFVGGIEKAFGNLRGATEPAATSFGNLLGFMGEILDMGTRLLNNVLTKLGPEFDKVVDALKPLLGPVEDVANTAIDSVKEILKALAEKVLPPLTEALKEATPALQGLLKEITPGVVTTLEALGNGIAGLAVAIKFLNDALGPLQEGNDLEWLGDLLFGGGGPGGKFEGVAPFSSVIEAFVRDIDWAGIGAAIADMWNTFWNHVVDGWNRIWSGRIVGEQPGKFIGETIENLKVAVKPLTDWIDGFFGGGKKEGPTVGGGGIGGRSIGGVIGLDNTDMSWFDTLRTNMQNAMGTLGSAFTIGGATAKLAWDTFWTNLNTGFGTLWEGIKLTASTKMNEIGTSLSTAGTGVQLAWDTFWTNLNTGFGTLWEGLKLTASTKMGEIGTAIQTGGEAVKTGWDGFWGGVGNILQGKWGEFQNTTGRGMGEVKKNVDTGMSGVSAGWGTDWAKIGTDMNGKWDGIIGDVSSNAAKVSPEMVAQMRTAHAMWIDSWNHVTALTGAAWTRVVSAISEGLARAGAEMNRFAGIARGALSIDLSGSGMAMIRSFASGISAGSGWVSGAVQAVIAAAKAFFPSSPAKVGPLSGKGYTTFSGRALVRDFAGGMMENMSMVRKASSAITDAAQLDLSSAQESFDVDSNGVTIERKTVNVNVYYPVAEPTSRTVEKSSSTLRLAGAL